MEPLATHETSWLESTGVCSVHLHSVYYLTVWAVEPVATHETSWLESTGVCSVQYNQAGGNQLQLCAWIRFTNSSPDLMEVSCAWHALHFRQLQKPEYPFCSMYMCRPWSAVFIPYVLFA